MLNWVEVDAAAIAHNLAVFRRRIGPDVRLGAVVKSNAYGHGMLEVSRISDGSADWLCVNAVDEGLSLREAGQTRPILIMGHADPRQFDALAAAGLRPTVYNQSDLRPLGEAAVARQAELAVHVKVETGTHRQGVDPSGLDRFCAEVAATPGLRLEGLSTHFANVEDTTDHRFARAQIETFEAACAVARQYAGAGLIRHAACSAAALLFDRTHLDLARVGISMYGIWSSRETLISTRESGHPMLDLRPALTWKSRVAQVKEVPDGAYVGYGCTYRTTRPSRIVVLPVGYHEGYDRSLSGAAYVLVRGRRAPIRGRICMNMCMAEVTDIPGVEIGDEAVLLGQQGEERVRVEQLAEWSGTIPYEILARIHPGLPRLVVKRVEQPAGS